MENYNLLNKKVLVVGLGASGLAACRLVLSKGGNLWVTEGNINKGLENIAHSLISKGAHVELGKHTQDYVAQKDLIIVSPGVLPTCTIFEWAKKYQIPVVSELEFASWYIKCPLICITGTNGKSTVTSLIQHIFSYAEIPSKKTIACGNLGKPLSEIALDDMKLDLAVVEVSSFQLMYIKRFRPYISVWLNFSYDHLDYHSSMSEYKKAKLRIFENQGKGDWAVIHYKEAERIGNIKAQKLFYGNNSMSTWEFNDIKLKGSHNINNVEAAVIVSRLCGMGNDEIRKAVRSFQSLSHRMEFVMSLEGVDFINDSKATNIDAVSCALDGFSGPMVLILGGRDKGGDFTKLKEQIDEKIIKVILIGEAKEKIKKQIEGSIPVCIVDSLDNAVINAFNNAAPGTVVLLSPGCSSFDMFKNYKERGDKFKESVLKLKGELGSVVKTNV